MIRKFFQFKTGRTWHVARDLYELRGQPPVWHPITYCGRVVADDAHVFISSGWPEVGSTCAACHAAFKRQELKP